jgi:hypothetical protein
MLMIARCLLLALLLAQAVPALSTEPQKFDRELVALAGEVQALLFRVDRESRSSATPNSILRDALEVQNRIYALAMETAEANSSLEKQGGKTSLSFSRAEAIAQSLALALDMTTHYYSHRSPKFRAAANSALAIARDLRTLPARD